MNINLAFLETHFSLAKQRIPCKLYLKINDKTENLCLDAKFTI